MPIIFVVSDDNFLAVGGQIIERDLFPQMTIGWLVDDLWAIAMLPEPLRMGRMFRHCEIVTNAVPTFVVASKDDCVTVE